MFGIGDILIFLTVCLFMNQVSSASQQKKKIKSKDIEHFSNFRVEQTTLRLLQIIVRH